MIRRQLLFLILITSISLILIPIAFFTIKFQDYNLSNNISDWGAFGSFVGGTVSTVVSILNLGILIYITLLVSKITSKENKKLYLYQRRIEAFESLMKFHPSINIIFYRLNHIISELDRKIREEKYDELSIDSELMKEFYSIIKGFAEFHYFLFSFNIRYSHIFNYKFETIEYKGMVEKSGNINEYLNTHYTNFLSREPIDVQLDFTETFKELFSNMSDFIGKLKMELE